MQFKGAKPSARRFGQYAALQRKLPDALLVSVDYDASTGEGTVESRVRMLLDTELQPFGQEAVRLPLVGGALQAVGIHIIEGVPGKAAHSDFAALRGQIPLQVPVCCP